MYVCYLSINMLHTIFIVLQRAQARSERLREPGQLEQNGSGLGAITSDYLVSTKKKHETHLTVHIRRERLVHLGLLVDEFEQVDAVSKLLHDELEEQA